MSVRLNLQGMQRAEGNNRQKSQTPLPKKSERFSTTDLGQSTSRIRSASVGALQREANKPAPIAASSPTEAGESLNSITDKPPNLKKAWEVAVSKFGEKPT